MPDYFKGRKCIKGKTIELIKKSRLVLGHCSTALIFANLFYKPVIFMTCSELEKIHRYKNDNVEELAKWFGKASVYLDDYSGIDLEEELVVSRGHYDDYRKAYIKTEQSEDLPSWQIIADSLRKQD